MSGWAPYNHNGSYKEVRRQEREREGEITEHRSERERWEAAALLAWKIEGLWAKECGQLGMVEKARDGFYPRGLQKGPIFHF